MPDRCLAFVLWPLAVQLACAAAPLPPEDPAEHPKERAPLSPILVDPAPERAGTRVAVVANIGLATPESVVHDSKRDEYLVSNIHGTPLARDNNGFISRIRTDGRLIEFEFIKGGVDGIELNAPKGMALRERTLLVTDIDRVRLFDVDTGKKTGEVVIEGSSFLNDVAVGPDGTIYVSDSGLTATDSGLEPNGTDAVYMIGPELEVEPLARGRALGLPNGLAADANGVWVVGFGSGELYHLAKSDGTRAASQKLSSGQLDGVVSLGDGSFLISSWEGACVFRGKPGADFQKLLTDLDKPADLTFDPGRSRLVIPLFERDTIEIHSFLRDSPSP